MAEEEEIKRTMTYLDLVEEFPKEPTMTQFEKIIVVSRRAKDLHDHDKVELVHDHFTAPYIALQELREGFIRPVYREEEEPVAVLEDDSEDAEEEE
ncbi:MAG TPA: DNA-directed RNA polymerase subunit omega [bacterium]|nr:DNA-directed RNA polymerase subunit omega [bacterium]